MPWTLLIWPKLVSKEFRFWSANVEKTDSRQFNNGTCIDGVNDYKCTCVPGFVGKNCNCKFKNIKPQYLYQFVRFTCTYHLNGFQISDSP